MGRYVFECIVRYNIHRFNALPHIPLKKQPVIINKITGEMLFQEKATGLQRPRDWRSLRLEWEEGRYEVFDRHSKGFFRCEWLQPLAYRVLVASLYAFLLEKQDLIIKTWHLIEREEAESVLEPEEVGTFLFRKDFYATLLENQLGYSCVTLTYLQDVGRVMDLTIIEKKGRWLFFDGDPELRVPSFATLGELLESLPTRLLYALPEEREAS